MKDFPSTLRTITSLGRITIFVLPFYCKHFPLIQSCLLDLLLSVILSWFTLRHIASHCVTLRHIASHCVTLRHIASHCVTLRHIASHCVTLRHIASHCVTLRHIASHCVTLRHIASHCLTLPHYKVIFIWCHFRPIFKI